MVDKTGSWFSMGEERLGQGRERAREAIKSDQGLADRIRAGVMEKVAAKREAQEAGSRQPTAKGGVRKAAAS